MRGFSPDPPYLHESGPEFNLRPHPLTLARCRRAG